MNRSKVLTAAERRLRKTCDSLPTEVRDDCYQEWAAELPVILDDPDVRPALLRWIFVWAFVLDQSRTVSRLQGLSCLDWARRAIKLISSPGSAVVSGSWGTVTASGFSLIKTLGANPLVAAVSMAVVVLLLASVRRRLRGRGSEFSK